MAAANVTPQIDPETISLDELRALADGAMAEEQPRDANGQFAKKTNLDWTDPEAGEQQTPGEEEQPAAPPAAPPTVFRRTIDLGDGSGVQVFEGATQDELIDKLAAAQTNATRKIREQQSRLRQHEQVDTDNEFVISQELLSKPTTAFKKMFEQMVGRPIEQFKSDLDKVQAFERGQSAKAAAEDFVTATPEYYDVPANGKKVAAYLNLNRLEWNVDNMKKAFSELSADGLLVARPQAPDATNTENAQPQSRIVTPAQPQTPKRVASTTIPSKRNIPVVPKPKLTEQDIDKLSDDQLRALANAELRGQTVDNGISF